MLVDSESGDLPGLLAQLREAGKAPDRALLESVKAFGADAVPALVTMSTDERLHNADSESAEVWAPLHAITLLGELEAAEAVEPLLPLFNRDDDDWLNEALPEALGHIGKPALGALRGLLFDRSTSEYTRANAATGLVKLAQFHPELRAEVIAILVERLDPAESQIPEDESVAAWVVNALLDLGADEAVPAIRQAINEDRIDRRIIDFDDVALQFNLPDAAGERPVEARDGLRLWLRCTRCHYERPHTVATVYYDEGTADRRKAGEAVPYSEYFIPQRIICPRCGAVDQYELTGMAYIALTAELLKLVANRRGDEFAATLGQPRLQIVRFTADAGKEMHPYEARDMYRQRIAAKPRNAGLRVGYANVFRVLRDDQEAKQQYQVALEIDPSNVEASYGLGIFAEAAGDVAEARRLFQHVIITAPRSPLPRGKVQAFVDYAAEALVDLGGTADSREAGRKRAAAFLADPFREGESVEPVAPQAALASRTKVGRNDPCPCGSGKKYKKCHGR